MFFESPGIPPRSAGPFVFDNNHRSRALDCPVFPFSLSIFLPILADVALFSPLFPFSRRVACNLLRIIWKIMVSCTTTAREEIKRKGGMKSVGGSFERTTARSGFLVSRGWRTEIEILGEGETSRTNCWQRELDYAVSLHRFPRRGSTRSRTNDDPSRGSRRAPLFLSHPLSPLEPLLRHLTSPSSQRLRGVRNWDKFWGSCGVTNQGLFVSSRTVLIHYFNNFGNNQITIIIIVTLSFVIENNEVTATSDCCSEFSLPSCLFLLI